MMMENTGTRILEAVAPESIAHLDPALTRANHSVDTHELADAEVKDILKRIKKVAEVLCVTPVQATVMIVAFTRKIQNKTVEWDDIHLFFGVKIMALLPLRKDFDKLVTDNYLVSACRGANNQYNIASYVMDAIMKNRKIDSSMLKDNDYSRYKFVREISDLVEQRSDEEISTRKLFEHSLDLEQRHESLSFIRNVQKLNLKMRDRVLFYEICDDFLANVVTSVNCTMKDMYEDIGTRFRIAKELMDEKHILQTLDLVELLPANIFSETEIALTDKGKELFLEDDFKLFASTKKQNRKLLYPDQIPEKQLYYDKELEQQLQLFSRNLEQENFARLQKRLEEKAMPKGIIALFHGMPGTGKTESALQIAKATGRAVCHVDIAASKSCWFGESEKIIKRIFTDYRDLCKKEKLKPILLFNEADALISKRKDSNSSNVAQTENAIQNIILEEMEKLDGIMIATTNLVNNLDAAFERRFLFKIRFGQPTEKAKKSIWKSRLEWLDDKDCAVLAARYDFSGGEIDNIARKITMEEVLNGTHPDLAGIEELCCHEKLGGKNGTVVGFKK